MKSKTNERILKTTFIIVVIWAIVLVAAARVHGDGRSYTAEDVDILCRCVWGEYRGEDTDQVAAVVWCILNRVDDPRFDNTIKSVVTAPYQFSGYNPTNPVDPRIQRIVVDVLTRWVAEETVCGSIGRILPEEYVYFHGNGTVNLYRSEYWSRDYWTWELESPYEVSE